MTQSQSGITVLKSLSVVSYDIAWAGSTPIGSVSVQLSNTYKRNPDGTAANPGSWNSIPFQDNTGAIVQTVAVSGNSGTAFIDIRVSGAEAIKIVYTPTSGSGSLTAVISGKVT
jgi:hypothetical protein